MIDTKLMEFATPRQLDYIIAIDTHGSHRKAATALGIHPTSIDKSMQALVRKAGTMGYSPEHHMTRPIAPGLKLRGTSQLFKAGQAEPALEWIKTSVDEEAREQMLQERIAALCEGLPVLAPVERTQETVSQELLNLYTFTDYHMGMLAWHKEGGSDWDLRIAEQMLWDAFRRMVDASPAAHTCVLNVQGDFLHSDGLLPVTPAHHHVLDQDGRFSKIVDVAIRVLRRLIAYALAKHEQVHLLIVEGNHDEASSIWLRRAFAAMYEDEPRLTVNDSELPYYVYQHGEVMLAFHHGHKLKNEEMPGLFAAQFASMWGATKKRYCHTGHRHHLDEKEYSGMVVTQHPTLSARDAYAARGGWIAERAALAITYHQKAGQYARTYITPELLN
jgi:hypothetical protein